jgi:diguanylate cyclase (GGDEF)-like protein
MIDQDDIHQARILLVDDDAAARASLLGLLGQNGYVAVSSTGDAGSVASMHCAAPFDLIVVNLDLDVPGKPACDGFAVMAALRDTVILRDPSLPVLAMLSDPALKPRAVEAGARDFLDKPLDPVDVLTRIHNVLEVRLLHREARDYGVHMEQTVRERTAALERFRVAMDATADAIFLIDRESMAIVDVSEGACRMLGYSREDLLRIEPGKLGLRPLRGHDVIETELQRADGSAAVPVEISWQFQSGSGALLVAVARDISERQQAQQRLKHLASYDALTGLPNRRLFFQNLRDAVELAQDKHWRVGVLFLSLDRFKSINDTLGATLGDELLRQFSTRLVNCVHLRDTVGRLGGDEFALILTMPRDQQEAAQVANEVREALRQPFDLHGQQAMLTASIGIAMYPDDAADPATLVKFADTAMVRAREAGRDGYRFFTSGMNVQVLARLDLELALRDALRLEQFVLHYQPKLNLNTGRINGVEALLRWNRPGHGMVYPAQFVPVMEETGMVVKVGEWIIDAACRQIAAWAREGVTDVRVAVNVSSRQFDEGDLEGTIRVALGRHQVDPALLELELTESALMSHAEHTIVVLERLRALGVTIAIDDFGTGYSSLAYLKRFPIDKLKIDIAFVRDITTNPEDAAIALAIISMAHSLHMQVVAEGVESRAQMAYLRRHRCDDIQGFHYSRALPAPELARLVRDNGARPEVPASSDGNLQTVLVVDDDVHVLAALHRLFRRDGYRVLTAASPAEGFELLALYSVQVIMSDQRMHAMSGTEFLSKVKEMYPDTVRIILSGDTRIDEVLDAINRGAIDRFYTRPMPDAALRDHLRQAFRHYWATQEPYDDRKTPREEPGRGEEAATEPVTAARIA